MALKTFKPNTPSNRYKQWNSFEEITKHEPEKSLTSALRKSGGRNNTGRITMRHIGGGHQRRYRLIDFKRARHDEPAKVIGIEYDTNRSARIARVEYKDGEKSYILAPNNLQVGAGSRQCTSTSQDPARHFNPQHRTRPRPWWRRRSCRWSGRDPFQP